jgi:hypothetical protein
MSNPFGGNSTAAATKAKAKGASSDPFDTGAVADAAPVAKGDPFSSPGGSTEHRISDFVGELVLVKPTEDIEEMLTEIGTTDAVRADVTPLTGPNAGELCEDMLIFQMALKRSLRKVMNGDKPYLLGRLTMGSKKPGKSAPYIFAEATAEEVAIARAHLNL